MSYKDRMPGFTPAQLLADLDRTPSPTQDDVDASCRALYARLEAERKPVLAKLREATQGLLKEVQETARVARTSTSGSMPAVRPEESPPEGDLTRKFRVLNEQAAGATLSTPSAPSKR